MLATPQVPFQSASLYVGDLNNEVTEGLLFEMFNRVGPVASIRVCRDAVARRSLGYAYVNFHNVQDAERALDTMNYTDIKGRPCRIMWSQRDPSLRKSGVGNVFVKNLATTVDNKGLFDVFSAFGNILSCKVVTDENGNSKGYGYVHYETGEAAQDAIAKVNGNMLEDQEVVVGHFLRRQERAGQVEWTNLYTKQFPTSWDENKLKEVFGAYGAIASIALARDTEGKSKAFGFVDYTEHSSAVAALEGLNGKSMTEGEETFELYVSRLQKKKERNQEMKHRMENMKVERLNKFQGMNIYVKNFDESITDEAFREMFNPFGTITSGCIMKDEAGVSKGFGFVCYTSPEEATKAVAEMNGKMILGKPMFVALHQRKEHRKEFLAASYGARGMPAMGGRGGFPMGGQAAPMPYMGGMYGNPMPRQPYMMGGMMGGRGGRGGPMGPGPFPGRGGYAMPQYGGMPQGQQQGQFKRAPAMGQQQQQQGQRRNVPQGRGAPTRGAPQQGRQPMQNNVKYTNQARNQPQPNVSSSEPLDHQSLAEADPQTQKNMIGERLYPLINQHKPELAGKITGMLLEMDNAELLHLLESPEALLAKTEEALQVLQTHMGQV